MATNNPVLHNSSRCKLQNMDCGRLFEAIFGHGTPFIRCLLLTLLWEVPYLYLCTYTYYGELLPFYGRYYYNVPYYYSKIIMMIVQSSSSSHTMVIPLQAMKTMVANIMAECDRLQVSSVAFPAIGTGMLGFPDNIVAKVMLQAIYSYLQTHLHSTLKRVFLVIFSDKTYKAFQSQFQTTLSCTQGATSLLQSSTQPSHHISSHTVAPPQPVYHSAHSSTAPTQVQSATLQSFVSNNVTIDIIHGDITSEDCDGIVSTSSCDLTLRNFGVMGALLKKGGTELQQECTAAVQRYGHLHSSKVIVTGTGRPGGLKCRRILHILAPYYVANDLQKVVKAVLREADKERLSVVSLPAIGTGKHGFSPRVAAEGICEAIVEFSKSQPKHVKYVKVVLFQEEHYSSFSTAFTAASSKKGLSPSRNALSHVCSAITPGHGTSSANSETPTVQRPPYILPSHAKPQQTGHTQNAARSPADSKQPQVQLKEGETSKNDHSSANAKTEEANVVKKKHFASMTPDGSRNTLTDSMTAVQDTSLPTVQIKRQNFMQEGIHSVPCMYVPTCSIAIVCTGL